MLLGVIPMFCFRILRIFGANRKMEENWKSGQKSGIRNPCRGVNLRQGVGYPMPQRG